MKTLKFKYEDLEVKILRDRSTTSSQSLSRMIDYYKRDECKRYSTLSWWYLYRMDATVLKIRVDRVVKNIAAYKMLSITLEEKKIFLVYG